MRGLKLIPANINLSFLPKRIIFFAFSAFLAVSSIGLFLTKGLNYGIDFQGGITIEEVRKFLRDEDSRESRALLSRLIEDDGMDDLMVTIADCLKEYIRTGINEDIVKAQLITYSES